MKFLCEKCQYSTKRRNDFYKHLKTKKHIKNLTLKNENIKSICFYEKPFKSWWEIFYYSIKNPLQNKDFLIHHLKNLVAIHDPK